MSDAFAGLEEVTKLVGCLIFVGGIMVGLLIVGGCGVIVRTF